MKKYRQSCIKFLSVLIAICCLMIAVGIVLAFIDYESQTLIFCFLGIGIPWTLILFLILLPAARNYLLIDDEKIVLPITRVPKIRVKRNVLSYNQINCIRVVKYKGDGLISKDTTFYRFILNDGCEFTETFYCYGKVQEREIVERLKKYVCFVY